MGGAQGIQLQGTQVYVQGQPVAPHHPPHPTAAPQPESSSQHLIRSLTITGIAALVVPTMLVIGLGVSSVLLPFAAGGGALALGLAHWTRKKSAKALAASVEHELMALAAQQGGELTVPVAAHHLRVPLEEADSHLMNLARAGHVEIHNDESSGAVLYRFPDIRANPSRYQALKPAPHD